MDNIFIAPNGKKYTCIVYAIDEFQSGHEWYGFEDAGDGEYFGFIHGESHRFDYFNINELRESNIPVYT
ncbi:hypothetical protein LCGC14_3043810, partial [marine sediment metagenome]